MKRDEAVQLLEALALQGGVDPENSHSAADAILLAIAGPEVRAAYQRVVDACPWWAHA